MSGKTPIIFLAGGFGTRLQVLDASRPKPMVIVKGKPFLYYLTKHYVELGYDHFIFSTGHLAEVIENYKWKAEFPKARFEFHREASPLGTGGAVIEIFKANPKLKSAWVVNGDTLLPAPLPKIPNGVSALYTALDGDEVFDAKPNMGIRDDRVVDMKGGGSQQYFDAGAVYVTRSAIEKSLNVLPCSIHEVLESSMKSGNVGYVLLAGTCYDIGTPERYKRFESYLETLEKR